MTETTNLNMLQLMLQASLVVKLVLFSLVAASVYSWAIILKKRRQFKDSSTQDASFATMYKSNLDLTELFTRSKDLNSSSLNTVYQEGYLELQRIREKFQHRPNASEKLNEYMHQHGMQALERSIQNGQAKVVEDLQESLSILASIGSITPFIGLFGTVWGIIDSFKGLSQGGGSLEAVAPGIAEALIATAIGLAAAIPAVWFFNIYQAKLSKVQMEMEQFEKDLINNIQRAINTP